MENLQMLQECNKRSITFKKAFGKFGVTRNDKLLKEMTGEEEFSALVNWAINKLPKYEEMHLRCKIDDQVYQAKLSRKEKNVRTGRIKEKEHQKEAITYAWPENASYENLDVDVIAISILRAKAMNEAKSKGQELSEQEATASVFPNIDWNMEEIQKGLGADRVLTEEEMELVNEFLQV